MQEYFTYAGFIISMAIGIAGWFWEFTIKDESGKRKHLTSAGRYAFFGTLAISTITFLSLIHQNYEKREAVVKAEAEKLTLEHRLARIGSSFDISHIEVAFALGNDHELVRRFRDGRDGAIQITSADPPANLPQIQRDSLRALIEQSAKMTLFIAKKGFVGDDPFLGEDPDDPSTKNYEAAILVGAHSLYDSADTGVKWGIRSWPNSKNPPTSDGHTIIHMTIPESAIQIPGGFETIRSFYDLAGRVVFFISSVGPIKLWYFRIHAKNRVQYPLFDSEKTENHRTLLISQGAFTKITIPSSVPWVPE